MDDKSTISASQMIASLRNGNFRHMRKLVIAGVITASTAITIAGAVSFSPFGSARAEQAAVPVVETTAPTVTPHLEQDLSVRKQAEDRTSLIMQEALREIRDRLKDPDGKATALNEIRAIAHQAMAQVRSERTAAGIAVDPALPAAGIPPMSVLTTIAAWTPAQPGSDLETALLSLAEAQRGIVSDADKGHMDSLYALADIVYGYRSVAPDADPKLAVAPGAPVPAVGPRAALKPSDIPYTPPVRLTQSEADQLVHRTGATQPDPTPAPVSLRAVDPNDQSLPKSFRTRNWGAITPQTERDLWPQYLKSFPGSDPSISIRDKFGKIIPAFKTDEAGVAVWWYWVHRRADFNAGSVSIREIAWKYSGADNIRDPAVSVYSTSYSGLAHKYFGRNVGLDERISLTDPTTRWQLAQVVFNHESGAPVPFDQATFDRGIKIGENYMSSDPASRVAEDADNYNHVQRFHRR